MSLQIFQSVTESCLWVIVSMWCWCWDDERLSCFWLCSVCRLLPSVYTVPYIGGNQNFMWLKWEWKTKFFWAITSQKSQTDSLIPSQPQCLKKEKETGRFHLPREPKETSVNWTILLKRSHDSAWVGWIIFWGKQHNLIFYFFPFRCARCWVFHSVVRKISRPDREPSWVVFENIKMFLKQILSTK